MRSYKNLLNLIYAGNIAVFLYLLYLKLSYTIENTKCCFHLFSCYILLEILILYRQLEQFKSLPPAERKYCKNCSLLIVDPQEDHPNHNIIENISSEDLAHPTSLLEIRENKKAEAVKCI